MRNFLRRLLGLNDDLEAIISAVESSNGDIQRIELRLSAMSAGMGRIVAKLDPMYGKSEFDPARKAESDKLGEETIRRLEAEDWARRHSVGEA